MKKIIIVMSLFLLTFVFVGCTDNFVFPITTTEAQTTVTTTTESFDAEDVLEDVYEIIYSEIYEVVKQEVLENISEERFDEIYADIVDDLLAEVAAGNITLTAESIVDVIQNVENTAANSVVGVATLDATGEGIATGSGVIYKQTNNRYYVVTNQHVVEDGTSYEIVMEDGTRISASLQGVDALVDLAVLYFNSEEIYEVSGFADSDLVNKGDIVLAVGSPLGFDYYNSITMGIVSGLDRYFDIDNDDIKDLFVNYIQHDAAINNGNSGGALFNTSGEVIGINVIKLSATEIEGMGFAIPSNLVSAIVNDIEVYGYSRQKPVLGINFIDIEGAEAFFVQEGITIPEGVTNGFYINAIVEGATMDGYLNPGDIVLAIDGVPITNTLDFIEFFSAYLVGDVISVTVYNPNGEPIVITGIELLPSVEG